MMFYYFWDFILKQAALINYMAAVIEEHTLQLINTGRAIKEMETEMDKIEELLNEIEAEL
jgi:hypothetical protein